MPLRFVRPLILASACALFSLPLAAQSSSLKNRIVAPVDETQLVTLRGNVHPLAQARFDRGAAPAATPTGRIVLVLGRSQVQQQALTQYLADVQNPSSPQFHQWLTPAQYGAQFGISDRDLQTVESWLQGHGFRIEKVPQGRNILLFSGNFGQLQSAFHTSIHTLAVNGTTHFGNMSDPQIPAALAPVIAGLGPLNDFHPQPTLVRGPMGRYNTATHSIQPTLTLFNGSTPLLFVDPADAATIYDTPNTKLNANYKSGTTWDGTGVKIGIAGDSNVNTADVSNYRVAFLNQATTSSNIPTVIVDGDDPGFNGDEVEALLDSEVSGGLAPGASLYFYTSANTDLTAGLFNAIFRALDDNTVSILNISFGACEADEGQGGNLEILETAEQAAAQGISVTVSTGDSGSAGCDNDNTETQAQNGLAVNGLASTPYNIAVGGTDYDVLATAFTSYASDTTSGAAPYWGTATKYIPEEPWNDSTSINTNIAANVPLVDGNGQTLIVAGGGGSSLVYPKPAFQTSLTPKDSARDLPDVSFLAGNGLYQTTWVVCGDNKVDTGSQYATSFDCVETNGTFSNDTTFIGVGGTSAAAPAFAGMLALVSQSQGGARLGQADGVLYQLAQSKYSSVFHDVTTGDNSVLCVSGSTNCGSNDFLTGYDAGTGYDLASGLGSVDVKNLITNWTTVKLASTTTALQLNSSTAAYTGTHGAAINFGVGVDPTTATGVVGIIDTASENASGPLNNGQFAIPLTSGAGTASYSGLPGGKYTVSARYGGDTSNAASTSSAISVDIAPETSTTLLQVDAYNPQTQASLPLTNIPYGSFVVADAQIQGTAEGANTEGVATGTVMFLNGGSSLATVNVSGTSNIASWPPLSSGGFVALTPGSYNVTANYSGDDSYYKSVSSAVAFTVAKAAGAINVTESPSTVYPDGSSTVNVTFTTPYNPGTPPQGGVTISLGSTVLASLFAQATIQVTGNTENYFQDAFGSIDASQLAPGNNTLTAVYSGDFNYASATETFNLYNTTGIGSFSMTNSGSLTLIAGQSGQEQVTVTPVGNFQGPVKLTCTSTANFCGGVQNITLDGKDSASAYFNFSTLFSTAPGTYAITMMGVDATGKTTASTTFNIIVTSLPANAGFTVTNGGNTSLNPGSSTYGQIMVTPTNGYIGTSTVTCSISTSIANPVSQPTCVPYYTALTITDTAPSSDSVQLGTTATTTAGSYTVTVTVTDQVNAAIAASTTFTLTVNAVPAIGLTNSGNFSIAAGATAGNTSTITVTPGGGFTGAVNLTCTVTPPIPNPNDPPTCSLQPTPVTITGSTAATATLTVKTTAPTTSALQSPLDKFFLGGGATLALLLFVGMPARRRAWRGLLSIAAILFVAGVIGCGGGGGSGGGGGGGGGGGQTIPGTSAGTYSVTVTGADAATGQITGNTSLTVTVN